VSTQEKTTIPKINGKKEDKTQKITLKRALKEQKNENRLNPRWLAPTFITLMVTGTLWLVVFYMTASATFSGYPIPNIGNWNLAIGLGMIMVGFGMTVFWK
jgi:hypothetical protein